MWTGMWIATGTRLAIAPETLAAVNSPGNRIKTACATRAPVLRARARLGVGAQPTSLRQEIWVHAPPPARPALDHRPEMSARALPPEMLGDDPQPDPQRHGARQQAAGHV